MSQNIIVDGKPLHLLRVVDLREELKKRGIKATGTKSHLQELLISAIESVQVSSKEIDQPNVLENKNEKDSPTNEENSNESSANNSIDNSEAEQKVASISINEEKETIKLTIRSSPRKSEPPIQEKSDSDTESSQSESETNDQPAVPIEESIDGKNNFIVNDTEIIDGNTISETITNEQADKALVNKEIITEVSTEQTQNDIAPIESVNHDDSKQIEQSLTTDNASEESDKTKSEEPDELKPTEATKLIENSKEIDESSEQPLENVHEPELQSVLPKKDALDLVETSSNKLTSKLPIRERLSEPKPIDDAAKSEEITTEQESRKPSIRGRLLSHSKSVNEEDSSKPIQKKRRWGSSHTSDPSVLKKGISSDKLKQLISESVINENDNPAKVSKVNAVKDEDESIQSTNELINDETEPKEVKKEDILFKSSDDSANKSINENEVEESPSESVPRPISPAKNQESTVLFVTGLVRPYTLPQLKKLLSANGPIDEEKFWIDKIKSKCYVVYSTTDEAIKTRESLHNLKWPQSSPKNLSVEFATLEDIDRCLNPENYEDLPPKSKLPVNDKKEAVIEINKGKYDIILNEPIRDKAQTKNSNKDDSSSRNIREWDRNKVNLPNRKENEEDNNRKRALSPVDEKKEKTFEKSKTPEKRRRIEEAPLRETNRKSESPAKMLEDLFRKTKATPYIYWLPLNDEQVIEKEKQRVILEKERQERITTRREQTDNKREFLPINRAAPIHPNLPRERPKFQDFRRRSPPPLRRKRSPLQSQSRYSRSRSPDRRRFSPRKRR